MEIVPDTKNWTWVLQRPCPECGLDVGELSREQIADMLIDVAGEWVTLLADPRDLRQRPAPSVWSPLEYACHVRDVFRRFDARTQRMLDEDHPLFENWDQDATAVADRYGEQDPATVALELRTAAERFAANLKRLTAAQWERTGRRSDGAVFTVESFARYFIHDPIHHLHDVTSNAPTSGEL